MAKHCHAGPNNTVRWCRSRWVTGKPVLGSFSGRVAHVFGAMSGRWWLGEVGRSEHVAWSGYLTEPVCLEESGQLLVDTRQALVARLTQLGLERWGLDAAEAIDAAMQMQVEWQATADEGARRGALRDRIGAFEDGYETREHRGRPRLRSGGEIKEVVQRLKALGQKGSADDDEQRAAAGGGDGDQPAGT